MTVLALAVAVAPLADSGEAKKSGPLGLVVILLLCVACYFLFKSMSKHMRKVREEFPSDEPAEPADGEPVTAASAETADVPAAPAAPAVSTSSGDADTAVASDDPPAG